MNTIPKVNVPNSREILGGKKTEKSVNYEQELEYMEVHDAYCALPGNSCGDDTGCF